MKRTMQARVYCVQVRLLEVICNFWKLQIQTRTLTLTLRILAACLCWYVNMCSSLLHRKSQELLFTFILVNTAFVLTSKKSIWLCRKLSKSARHHTDTCLPVFLLPFVQEGCLVHTLFIRRLYSFSAFNFHPFIPASRTLQPPSHHSDALNPR